MTASADPTDPSDPTTSPAAASLPAWPALPACAWLTAEEIDSLWHAEGGWTDMIRRVEAAVHRKLYQSTL